MIVPNINQSNDVVAGHMNSEGEHGDNKLKSSLHHDQKNMNDAYFSASPLLVKGNVSNPKGG